MATPALLSLEDVLHRADIWRGEGLAGLEVEAAATGFAALDAQLPGGGWPRGVLVELMAHSQGIGELALLLPALRSCTAEAPLAVVSSTSFMAHAPAWAAQFPLSRLLMVQAPVDDIAWSVEQLLTCAGLGAVLAWLPERIHPKTMRRLQMAVQGSRCLAFMFRSPASAEQASPAPLRLSLEGGREGLQVRILKRRGAPCDKVLSLAVERPVAWTRVQAGASKSRSPARKPALVTAR